MNPEKSWEGNEPPYASATDQSTKKIQSTAVVSVRTLVLVGLSFAAGMVAVFVWQNAQGGETIAFSTPDLLGFLFSVTVSGASIVLAVTAIALGRSSEQAMIERSDESIRLQNELYARTTDALERIEASTGVTEKRIEDIIAGRVGDISESVAERAGLKGMDIETLRDEIQESILEQLELPVHLSTERVSATERARRAQIRKVYHQYSTFKESLQSGIANETGLEVVRIGEGNFTGRGLQLLDGAYRRDGEVIGLSAFSTHKMWRGRFESQFGEYLDRVAKEVAGGTIDRVFLAFNDELEEEGTYRMELDRLEAEYDEEIVEQFQVLTGSAQEIVDEVVARLAD